ncbi:MAG: TIM barrel protein, partial [Pirellula sp.]
MKSSITFSAVPEAQGGPFVYWGSLELCMRSAKELGFVGIEIFPPGPEYFQSVDAAMLAKSFGLQIAAIGSGAGWVKHKLSMADADSQVRCRAIEFLLSMLDAATQLEAPLIIGSMQGRSGPEVGKPQAKQYLRESRNSIARQRTCESASAIESLCLT